MTWRRVDLHLHTPASVDYQEPGVSALDILRRADERGLDIIAFTDHNSVRGYADMWREIEDLELLEYLKRLEPAEADRLADYRRLLGSVLLLPGFEFTATFGFHILAIFPERTSVRLIEHLLLLLGVPEDRFGSGEVGATTDVLRTYEILSDHGALVIGAHVNSTHGIAMQGLRFGGQTKIAYTQDEHLHALEVTDLAVGGNRRSTARFFNGTKPEYPRRMHCIQGSDAHRLDRDSQREANLGVGDRVTEILLPEASFAALKAVFTGDDFTRTRPYLGQGEPLDAVKSARLDGNTLVQAFHESLSTKRTGLTHVLRDVVAMANTNGGTIYVGVSPFEKRPIAGVPDVKAATEQLQAEVARQISPPLAVSMEPIETGGKTVLVIRVPHGPETPYALDPGGIYVRQEGESALAGRDQIVAMVRAAAARPAPAPVERVDGVATPGATNGRHGAARRGRRGRSARAPALDTTEVVAPAPVSAEAPAPTQPAPSASRSRRRGRRDDRSGKGESGGAAGRAEANAAPPAERLDEVVEDAIPDGVAPPSGVEVLHFFEQDGVRYYTVRDLRHSKFVHNVTRDTPSRLWRTAIALREERDVDESQVRWQGDYGYWRSSRVRGGDQRYNLVYRGDGDLRVFYGVSPEGLDDCWRAVLPEGRR
jgi:hypothetical protein